MALVLTNRTMVQPLSAFQYRAGVSSFAYQGTNAHLTAGPSAARGAQHTASTSNWPWRKTRYWFQTTCHPLLHAGAALASGGAAVHLVIAKPALRYLWDHCIQVPALQQPQHMPYMSGGVRACANRDGEPGPGFSSGYAPG